MTRITYKDTAYRSASQEEWENITSDMLMIRPLGSGIFERISQFDIESDNYETGDEELFVKATDTSIEDVNPVRLQEVTFYDSPVKGPEQILLIAHNSLEMLHNLIKSYARAHEFSQAKYDIEPTVEATIEFFYH